MRYLILIPTNAGRWATLPQSERDRRLDEHIAFTRSIIASGEHIDGAVLSVPSAARTVRLRDGAVEVTDGPLTESEEYLGGYYLVECASDDRAAEIAARVPDARLGPVEVRSLKTITGLMVR
ncbi:YciI family protein [Nocardiopsis mangrovi]|uniref:YciI family protein n=1 Tax=Nocardiopsis mangrovi TaxID=1179818 RepID=A0ABV9E3A9_9ACTN